MKTYLAQVSWLLLIPVLFQKLGNVYSKWSVQQY